MLAKLKSRAREIKQDTHALYFAYRDKRTPFYAKLWVLLVLLYALSPIDLIPDFIPVLGYLDDLILIPLGITLALKLIPAEVMADARAASAAEGVGRNVGIIGAILIVIVWLIVLSVIFRLFLSRL